MSGRQWWEGTPFLPKGADTVVILEGTPHNVELGPDGIRVTWWADGADSPHAEVRLTWAELAERAVAQ